MSRTPALDFTGGTPSKRDAERMLEVPTRFILDARERNAGLAALDLEGELERLEHEWVPMRGVRLHLERHDVDPAAPTVIVAHGLGDHSRRHLALAAALAERGMNSLLIDRQGHGLSEGRRGDAPLELDLAAIELAIGVVRSRSDAPVILLGDSLGGIMSWYLLTREPDVDAAICHCIGHPDEHPDPYFRFKAPVVRALGRLLPLAPIPVRQVADYAEVALDPVTRGYFEDEVDPIFNFSITARSAASYIGFRPRIPWERVLTPSLVVIGAADRMVTPAFTRRSFERATPPAATYMEIPGAGHQLFLDHIGEAIGPVAEWIETVAAPEPSHA